MDILALGKNPISEDLPAGKDVRYEENYDALSSEMAKLGSIAGSAEIEWEHVVSLCCTILEKESKHLQVAAYLNYGLMKADGLAGLAQGIHILKELLENFWDPMFPPRKRMKGRRGIIVWWEEKISEFLDDIEPETWERTEREQLINELQAIDMFLEENMDNAPLLIPLTNKVKSVVEAKEEVAEKPVEKQPEAASEESSELSEPSREQVPAEPPKAPQRAKEPQTVPDIPVETDPGSQLDLCLNVMGKTATNLIAADPFSPIPYRLNRIAAWITIDELPTAAGGKTMIPPPDQQVIDAISALYANAQWEDLADACEANIRQFLFWLDLSRYVAHSMEQLGHELICNVIETETQLFTGRLNGIEKMSFSDGTPFAGPETRQWLAGLKDQVSHSGTGAAVESSNALEQTIAQKMTEAKALIQKQEPDQAIALLMEQTSRSASEREKFFWKMSVCQTLIDLKQVTIASSVIEEILAYIEQFQLEKWEPDYAVDALSLSLTGLRLQQNDQHAPLIDSIMKRICVLDPIKAMSVI